MKTKNKMDFISSHKLDFLCAYWPLSENFKQFKVGTCSGLWSCERFSYCILAVVNHTKGNGHFDDVLEWFEYSCKRDNYSFKFFEVWNDNLKKHLINKRGFVEIEPGILEKKFIKN
jgi:hypothetical protein